MFEYVIDEKKEVVSILKEGKEIGALNYQVRGNSICVDIYKMPFDVKGANAIEFDEYFAFFNKISNGLEEAFNKKVILGVFPSVKEFDEFAKKVDDSIEKQPIKAKGMR